ncbi:MAG: hypothetical protein NTX49_08965 [Chlamydiae bacterium]|nr:hypothetical protein [Chlamydiota bacterium]
MAIPSISAVPIDYQSLNSTIGQPISQLLVYGFADCGWEDILSALRKDPECPVKKIFDYEIAVDGEEGYTLEGRHIEKVITNNDRCKRCLVNLVLENVKRSRAELPLIPILFLIDTEAEVPKGHSYPPSPVDVLENRGRLTMTELRRAYKLCESPLLPSEITEIAKKTFCFAKLLTRSKYQFQKISAPWEGENKPAWDELWEKMHPTSGPYYEEQVGKIGLKRTFGLYWIDQLTTLAKPYLRDPS